MKIEDIMLSEISQSQKEKYFMISQYEVSKIVKPIETGRRIVVCQRLETDEWEAVVQQAQISVMQDE